ncbi:MAG: flagellar basal body L-ring protein FlgH [Spirochaetes bacterium]|nr:flagellar basal body L-ring protein FlgH [Spirochaetota bacterium]
MRIHGAIITMVLLMGIVGGQSKSLWQDRNIYGASETLKEGDVILVRVNDLSQMKFELTVSGDNSFNIVSNPDNSITQFLPKASANKSSTSKGKTAIRGTGKLLLTIPARVMKKIPGNLYEIAGTKEYTLHGMVNQFQVVGIVDPSMVKGKSIDSTDIAQFRFVLKGFKEGAGIEIKRPPLKEKEAAGVTLTEDEKQKIILEYLNKIINELTQ